MQARNFTFGVEEEFIVVNPFTGLPALYDFAPFSKFSDKNAIHFSPEMHETVLEVKSPVCTSLAQLCESIVQGREVAGEQLSHQGLALMASGTHPCAHWRDIPMVAHPTYQMVVDEYQDVARSNFIFGMHLHIGFDDPSLLVPVMNAAREDIPLILALSGNSPFWQGAASGLHSYRSRIFEKLPRTGVPDRYQDLEEYNQHIEWLLKTGCIKKPTSIWSDVRIHPYYQTLEIRVADMQTKTSHAQAIAIFMAGLCMMLANETTKNTAQYRPLLKTIIEENKWRAARWGLNCDFIVSAAGDQIPARTQLAACLKQITPFLATALEPRLLSAFLQSITQETGAERQLTIASQGNATTALLHNLMQLT